MNKRKSMGKTSAAGVGSGAAALEVGLGEHRTERIGKCHIVANGAPWNVALRGFPRVKEKHKPSPDAPFLPQSSTGVCVPSEKACSP